MEISCCRGVIILSIWAAITIAVGLMAGLINKGGCDEPGEATTTPSTPEGSTTLPPPDGPWGDPMLPDAIIPRHYSIWLYPDFYYDGSIFYGREDVTIEVAEETEYIILHIKAMTVNVTSLYDADGKELGVKSAFGYEPLEYWVVEPDVSLTVGARYVLHLEFSGSLTNGIVGYYKSTYVNADTGVESWLATSKFQPTDARKAFPNWDEPRFKATFNITLRHWQNFTAISNMPEYTFTDMDVFWRETSFEETVVMSSYLVCFIVFDFHQKNNTLANGKISRVWAPPDRIDSVDFALNFTKQAQDFLEGELDMIFQLPKLDSVAVPDYPSGATEHWGLITYRESRLLYDPAAAGANDEQNTAAIVAHELSHHFFGNAITCYWWDDIWLNEGFANFYEQKALGLIAKYEAKDEFLISNLQPVMADDALSESRQLVKEVTTPDEVNAAFSGLIYNKGASLIRMMENYIGVDEFRSAMQAVLKKYEFGSISTPELYATLKEETGVDVPELMAGWTYQMGLPVVTVTEGTGEIALTPSRFLSDPEADPTLPESDYEYKWNIPLDYATQGIKNGSITIASTDEAKSIQDPRDDPANEWIILNKLQMGYCRVNYSPDMWAKLAAQLRVNHEEIYVADRSMILDDAFNLARATLLDYPTALDLTQYMEEERAYFPWRSATRGLQYISTMMYSNGAYTMWRSYIQNITGPIMDDLQVEGTGNHLDILNRRNNIITLACGHGNQGCLTNTTRLFEQWLEDPDFVIDPDIRLRVYQYGMLELSGIEGVWDEVLDRYEKESSVSEKSNLMYTLAQTDRQWLIFKYLDYANTPGNIREQDFFTLINYLAANPDANRYVWDWTREHYDELVAEYGTSNRYFGRMVPNIVVDYNSEFLLAEVEEFFAKYPDAGAGAEARLEALASIRSNIAWMDENLDDIVAWLEKFLGQ